MKNPNYRALKVKKLGGIRRDGYSPRAYGPVMGVWGKAKPAFDGRLQVN